MPFKDDEEKRQYIKDHMFLFNALGIKMTNSKIEKLVNDHSKDEAYSHAKKLSDDFQARDTESKGMGLGSDELNAMGLDRLPRLLYDSSGTPEANKWNQELWDMCNGPDSVRKIADLGMKIILEADDKIVFGKPEDAAKHVYDNQAKMFFIFGGLDMVQKLDQIYDMNDPKQAAVVNAVKDKFLLLQGMTGFQFKYEYEASKLFTILPDVDDVAKAEAIMGIIHNNRRKLPQEPKGQSSVDKSQMLVQTTQYNKDFINESTKSAPMLNTPIIGKEGIYHRAYIETPEGKKYLTKNDVQKAYVENKDVDKIKYEEVSAEDRKAIDTFLKETKDIRIKPVFKPGEKKEMVDILAPIFDAIGKPLTPEKIDEIVKDPHNEASPLKFRDVKEQLSEKELPIATNSSTGIQYDGRITSALYLEGDSDEVKQWNEKVALLSQTEEGLKQLTDIGTKRLLSVDMKTLTEGSLEARREYLLSHPVESKLLFLASNFAAAYMSKIKLEGKETDPVYQALEKRVGILEEYKDDYNKAVIDGSRVLPLLGDLDKDQVSIAFAAASQLAFTNKDPEKAEHYKEIADDLNSLFTFSNDAGSRSKRQIAEELYKTGVIDDNTQYKRIHAEVPIIVNGEVIRKQDRSFTLNEMITAIEKKELEAKDFKFDDISKEDKEYIDKFLAEAPDTPTLNCTEEEKKQLTEILEVRTTQKNNFHNFQHYANELTQKGVEDKELKELLENVTAATGKAKNGEAFAKALKYVTDHKDHSKNELDQLKLDIALTTLAILDGDVAKKIVEEVNYERKHGHVISQPQINLEESLRAAGVKPGTLAEKKPFDLQSPFDRRIKNVKEAYDRLNGELNPWHHHNSREYRQMLQSMKNVLTYASTAKNPDARLMEGMFKNVEQASRDYLLKEDAGKVLGQNRKSAALATVAALNPKEGERLLDQVNAENRVWARALCEKVQKEPGTVTIKDVMSENELTEPLDKDAILGKMKKEVTRLNHMIHSDRYSRGIKADLIAEFVVKNGLYNTLKSGAVEANSSVVNLSQPKVKEATEKVMADKNFREVIKSEKDNLAKEDVNVKNIERVYMDKVKEVLDEQKAEEPVNEAEAIEDVMPEAVPEVLPEEKNVPSKNDQMVGPGMG